MIKIQSYFGWLIANTIGFKHEAVFAKKHGSWEASGVIKALFPKHATMTIIAYGDL
jgi:hypothetical protein